MEGKDYYNEGLIEKELMNFLLLFHSKARIPISKEVFESDVASLTFAMGLMGDVTELEHLISVDEAARMWGITPQHVRRLCERGDIRSKKIGRNWVIDKRQENPTKHRKGEFSEIVSERFEEE